MSSAYLSIKEKEKAVEMANAALKLDPKSPSGHYAMSRILYGDGKYDKALESINVAIQLFSKSPYYFLHRADIYMKLRNDKSALKDYEQACNMKVSWGCQRAQVVKQQMAEAKSK
jgi:tetratricopeptide (TPR) repeat protein